MIATVEEFLKLRTSDVPDEYMRAGLDIAPIEVWFEIIEKHPEMREWVALNHTIPEEVQIKLSQDNDVNVRCAIASKYPLNRKLYESFASDSDEGVRRRIVYNKKTPLDILKKMSDEDVLKPIRMKAAEKYSERTKTKEV